MQCTWIRDWGEAKRLVRSLRGTFKSDLFRKSFQKGSRHYPFESLIIHDGRRFYGVLTCRYIRNTVAPGVHHVWHVGDVDEGIRAHARGGVHQETWFAVLSLVLGRLRDAVLDSYGEQPRAADPTGRYYALGHGYGANRIIFLTYFLRLCFPVED